MPLLAVVNMAPSAAVVPLEVSRNLFSHERYPLLPAFGYVTKF